MKDVCDDLVVYIGFIGDIAESPKFYYSSYVLRVDVIGSVLWFYLVFSGS